MAEKLFFENIKIGKRFEVVRFDKERGVVVLRSNYAEFEEEYSKEKFEKLGYKLVKVETEDAE